MAKRIVVCSDGTGNTAIKGRGTNVFKMFEAVDLNGHRLDPALTPQVAIYDDGVGTEDFKPLKLLGGAFGWGLSRNVKQLYKELARVYDPGDEIYVFGFSRGAFTVRSLVGFISTCGLVDPQRVNSQTSASLEHVVDQAYAAYRKCYRPRLWSLFGAPAKGAGQAFKIAHSVSTEVRIRFVGVWDTVDAVGLPFHISDVWNATVYRFKFPDHDLSQFVDRACQALSIDDPRQTFLPQLWNEAEDSGRISQVWFAGVHSNVGGGYPKQGMSLVALDWMLAEAERAGEPFHESGLRINRTEEAYFRDHASVDDKLYDPRANMGIFYRWKIRDIAQLCREHHARPRIHLTALERIAHGTDDYAPGNLPADAEVVITRPTKGEDVNLALKRAANLQRVLSTVPEGTLLSQVRPSIRVGVAAYYVYLASCVAVVLAASGLSSQSLSTHPWLALETAGKLVVALVSDPTSTTIRIASQIIKDRRLAALLAAGFVAAYLMMLSAGHRMASAFSGFWYPRQSQLRDALKRARLDAASGR
jgi:uncharacterized protein (DUF2235 family)